MKSQNVTPMQPPTPLHYYCFVCGPPAHLTFTHIKKVWFKTYTKQRKRKSGYFLEKLMCQCSVSDLQPVQGIPRLCSTVDRTGSSNPAVRDVRCAAGLKNGW